MSLGEKIFFLKVKGNSLAVVCANFACIENTWTKPKPDTERAKMVVMIKTCLLSGDSNKDCKIVVS